MNTTPAAVAVLGLGTMGLPMAINVRNAGIPTVVWNRTPPRDAVLDGLEAVPTAAEAAARAAIVVTMVADAPWLRWTAIRSPMVSAFSSGTSPEVTTTTPANSSGSAESPHSAAESAMDRLRYAVEHPAGVTEATAALAEAATTRLYDLECHSPARLLTPTVHRHLSTVTALLEVAQRHRVRRRLTTTSAESMLLAGWLALDWGDTAEANRFWDSAIGAAVKAERDRAQATADAREEVRPYVGALKGAFDSAIGVYQAALGVLGVADADKIDSLPALKAVLNAQHRAGSGSTVTPKPTMATDAAVAGDLAKRFPHAANIRVSA